MRVSRSRRVPVLALLRGANLGSKRFSPTALVKALDDLDITNIGAAGTFVIRKRVAQKELRERLTAELPFEPEIIVCSAKETLAALAAGSSLETPEGARRFATVMAKEPATPPSLPLVAPPTGEWGVRVLAIEGRFALGTRRPMAVAGVYPNEVVEKAFGVRATTRDWPTMEKVAALLA